MTPSEVVELALEAYRNSARTLLAASAPASLLGLAGFMFFWSYAFPLFWSTRNPDDTRAQIGEAVGAMGLAIFVAAPVALYGAAYVAALTTHIVSDFMAGSLPNAAAAQAAARRATPVLLRLLLRQVATAGVFFVIAIGLLFVSALTSEGNESFGMAALTAGIAVVTFAFAIAFAPAVMVRDALVPAAAVIENLPPRDAIRRGRSLIGSSVGAPLIAMLLIAFLFGVFGWGLFSLDAQLGIGQWVANTFVGAAAHDIVAATFAYIPWYLVIWVSVPMWSTVCTILYFERRVSREGYDIEVLAQEVWRNTPGHRFQL